MNASWIVKIVMGCMALMGIVSLWMWLSADMPYHLEERIPGMDKSGQAVVVERSRTGPEGQLETFDGVPADFQGAWPCFRGADLDNIFKGSFPSVPKEQGFSELWGIDAGEGFAGAAIWNGRVYLLDYDREKKMDAIRCLSLADGKEIWRYSYPVSIKRNHGMSRTVPAVTNDWVITIGPKCHVHCLNPVTGEKKWSLDMVYAYDAEVPPWYTGQCPLVDDRRLILAPGGSALLVALDGETGEPVWESPNPHGWKMTHSSVMPMNFKGRRMYLYCASGGVVGVSADDGRILWETDEWKIRIANVPSPLVIDEDRIFFCGGYKAGSMMVQLVENEGKITPNILFRLTDDQFGSTQHTPILYQDHIYGIRPDGQFACLDLQGQIQWTSTSAYKFGNGSYLLADSVFYILNDSGLLSRVEATPAEFRLIDQTKVLQGHESWGPIALASGRMILRDLTRMVCLKVALN